MEQSEPTYYYRVQDAADNELASTTGKLGGHPARNVFQSRIAKVKAWIGRLPADEIGIEFTTMVPPDSGSPPGIAYWCEGSPGVEIVEPEELVLIPVTITARRDYR
jgi:hypothetical protein